MQKRCFHGNKNTEIKSRPADQKIFQNRKKVKDTEYPAGASSLTFFLFWIDYFSFNRDGFFLFRSEYNFGIGKAVNDKIDIALLLSLC